MMLYQKQMYKVVPALYTGDKHRGVKATRWG